jgi:hypothetical protein
VKKIFILIWVLGVILLCSFRTPVKYYQVYDRFIVIYTHIFSDRGILMGQLVLYVAIWSVLVLLVYYLFTYLKKSM